MSTNVEVGQVRRERPRRQGTELMYESGPFVVTHVGEALATVRGIRGDAYPRIAWLDDLNGAPLWPDEHEQYRDARGYEVRHG